MRLIFVAFFLLLVGCRIKTAQQRFAEFIKDPKNKITQTIAIGDVTATTRWMPEISEKTMNDVNDNTSDQYDYFDVKFERREEDKVSKEKIMYLDFDIGKDFMLAVGKDSIPPAICQRIPNGHSGNYEYLLAFEKSKKSTSENFTIVYKDRILSVGTLEFVYNRGDLKKIPTLAAK